MFVFALFCESREINKNGKFLSSMNIDGTRHQYGVLTIET